MVKRGMTLIELMVAVSIFVTVMTLGVGGFIAVSRSRILISNLKDTQQKVRVANEMITRYAKQAENVKFAPSGDGSWLELYFDISTVSPSAKRFVVSGSGPYDLLYEDCTSLSGLTCNSWTTPGTSLLGGTTSGISLKSKDVFELSGVLSSVLEIDLQIQNIVQGYPSLSDYNMDIQNAVILEGLK